MSLDPIRGQVDRGQAESLSPIVVEGGVSSQQPQIESAIKAGELARLLHQLPTGSSPSGTPLFTGAAKSAQDVSADYSSVLRQLFGNHGIGATGQDSALFSAMGTTTSFNSLMGAIAAKSAYERYQGATELGYGVFSAERVESGLDIVRGSVQSMAGAAYIPYRPLSMTTSILGVNAGSFTAPSVLGQVTYSLGTVGSFLFGIFYACLGVFFASNTARLANFSIKMWKAGDCSKIGDVPKIITFLKDRIGVTASSTLEQIQKDHPHLYKAELSKLAVDSTCRFIKATLKEAIDQKVPGISKRSEKECRKMAENILEEFDVLPADVSGELCAGLAMRLGLTPAQAKGLSFVELLGLDIKTALREKRDEAELSGYIGGGTVAALKKGLETGLIERLSCSDKVVQDKALEEAEALIKNASSSMRWNAFVNVGLLFAGVVGLIATIMNFIPATANLAVTGAIWLVCSISMLPVDGYCLFSSQNSEGPIGKYDKALLYASTVVGVLSLLATVVLANVFSMGIPALVIGIAIGVLWLGNNVYSMHKLNQKDKKYQMDHPTLASMVSKLQEEIEAKAVTERLAGKKMDPNYGMNILGRLKKTAKNLSKDDKKALKAEMASRAGIKDPAKRDFGTEGDGLVLPKVTAMDLDKGKKDLQTALEDCLQNAPVSTLRILEEMGSVEGLKKLCQALKKVIQEGEGANTVDALEIFRGLGAELKNLVDNQLAVVYGFGEMYFDQHTSDGDVLRAVEKAFECNRSSKELSMLYDYLSVIAKKGSTAVLVAKAKELFSKLSRKDKAAVTLNIYNKRAKKVSSRHFAQGSLTEIQIALEAVNQVRSSEMASGANLNHRLHILPLAKTA